MKWSARYKDVLIRENSLAEVKSFYTNDGKIFLRTTKSRRHDTEVLWDGYGHEGNRLI